MNFFEILNSFEIFPMFRFSGIEKYFVAESCLDIRFYYVLIITIIFFRFLVEHKLVDCIVTTAGGVEEDLIKCLAPTYLGDWYLRGKELRMKGLNRIGNLIVPNDNYCKFEDWVMPILDSMLEEQKSQVFIYIN